VALLGGACIAARRLAELEEAGRPQGQLDRAGRLEIERALRLRACLQVRRGATVDSLEQELCVLAVATLPDLPLHAVTDFADAYLARLRGEHAGMLAVIRAAGQLSSDEERRLLGVAADVATSFRA
jgi:hypothetical protein